MKKILVISDEDLLTGLVTMKDIDKSAEHPLATKDSSGSLQVGAALGTGTDTLERAIALSEAGADLFVIDSAHGHSQNVIETIKMIKKAAMPISKSDNKTIYLDMEFIKVERVFGVMANIRLIIFLKQKLTFSDKN